MIGPIKPQQAVNSITMSTTSLSSPSPSSRRPWLTPGIIAALIVTVCVWFLWQISEIVVLFLISLLMFYVIDPLITSIERGLKLNRTGAIMLFYLLCLIAVGLVLWLVLPVVVGQFQAVYSLLTDEAVQADFVN